MFDSYGGLFPDPDQVESRFMAPKELAARMGVHYLTVLKRVDSGEIKAIRFGRKWKIPIEEANRVMQEGFE